MCVKEATDAVEERKEKSGSGSVPAVRSSAHLESICENTVPMDIKHKNLDDSQRQVPSFVPTIRCGEWSHIGRRSNMEDTHVCIADLAKKFGCNSLDGAVVSFYGVFDGHGGKDAAHFVRDNLPRVIVEDTDFPLELEKVVTRSFMKTDAQFAQTCSVQSALPSGTTALTAMIFGRSLLVANAGDCRAVLSRNGLAFEMSKDHRPCCVIEKKRVESLGGYIEDNYLNGELAVTRALGNWHIEGLKMIGGGPLSAEPELKMTTLTKEDEFLIIGSDGLWEVFSSQNAVDFARRRLQQHNDVKMCCQELVEEAIRRDAHDNLTALMVCFHSDPPKQIMVHRSGVKRCISTEGLRSLKSLLES